MMALRLLHSDAELHRRHCPADPVERLIFELLEQLRVETLVPDAMPGMAAMTRAPRAPPLNWPRSVR